MKVLADFRIQSDLCLPDSDPPLRVGAERHGFEVTVSNVTASDGDPAAVLAFRITLEAPSVQEARAPALDAAALAMSALSYSTNRAFRRPKLLRLVECTDGGVERDAIVYHESAYDDRTQPGLTREFGITAAHLLSRAGDERLYSALRWYRLGVQAEPLEEQFSYFWFALEIAAQKLKSVEKKYSECPRCHGKLYCEVCEKHPMHRPYPGEAIEQLVRQLHPQSPEEIFATLQKIRHTIMHGERIESVEHELPCSAEQAINKLANITWNALGMLFDPPQLGAPVQLAFGIPDSFVRKTMVMGVNIRTTVPNQGGTTGVPDLDRFPKIEVSLAYGDRKPTSGEPPDSYDGADQQQPITP